MQKTTMGKSAVASHSHPALAGWLLRSPNSTNRFNGFRRAEETVETVRSDCYDFTTQLKQGVNERLARGVFAFPLALMVLFLVVPASLAQTSKQELNDQFYEAVRKGDTAAVTALLDKGADVNAKFRYGATALFKAAERGHTEIVKLLLARGADVTVKDTFYGANAMSWALSNGHTEAVKALLEKDSASVGDVLMSGVREGKADLVQAALAKGGVKPETLTSALAAASNNKEISEMLKKAGAVPPVEIDAATLQTYAGRYRNEQGVELSLTVKDGKPFLTPPGQPAFPIMALDKVSFRPVNFDGLVITVNLESGRAVSLSVKQGTNTTLFKRVEDTQPK